MTTWESSVLIWFFHHRVTETQRKPTAWRTHGFLQAHGFLFDSVPLAGMVATTAQNHTEPRRH
jgi:hypothetical protein